MPGLNDPTGGPGNFRRLLSLIGLAALPVFAAGLDFPLDLHGTAGIGKYLNSDTARYFLDLTTDFYCTVLAHEPVSVFIRYRDDLDVAGWPEQGVLFDPQRAHYHIAIGTDAFLGPVLVTGFFMHDCVHRIDSSSGEAPIFNRLKIALGAPDLHYARQTQSRNRLLWRVTAGWYPGWQYHDWSVNAGADYRYDLVVDLRLRVAAKGFLSADFCPSFNFTRSDSASYQQHALELDACLTNRSGRAFGVGLVYNLKNNDPIKSPDRLWLLKAFLSF